MGYKVEDFIKFGRNSTYIPNENRVKCIEIMNNLNINLPLSSGVYLIEFCSGGFYVGRSINIARRIWSHLVEVEERISSNEMYNVIKSDGLESIKVIVLSNNQKDEDYWILKMIEDRTDKCYNKYIPKKK